MRSRPKLRPYPALGCCCLTTAWVPSGGYLSSLCNGAAFLCPTRPSLILLLHHPRPTHPPLWRRAFTFSIKCFLASTTATDRPAAGETPVR